MGASELATVLAYASFNLTSSLKINYLNWLKSVFPAMHFFVHDNTKTVSMARGVDYR